jgi:hypothetical protein
VDVSLFRERLRHETNEKTHNGGVLFSDKAGCAEVDKEKLGEHLAHAPSAPPLVQNGYDPRVVRRLNVPYMHDFPFTALYQGHLFFIAVMMN